MTDHEEFEKWWLTKFSAEFLDSDNCWSAWTGWQARGELEAVRIKELEAKLDKAKEPYNLVEILNDPMRAYPHNFSTPAKGNALLFGLCQEAADKIESLKKAIEIKPLSEILGEDE